MTWRSGSFGAGFLCRGGDFGHRPVGILNQGGLDLEIIQIRFDPFIESTVYEYVPAAVKFLFYFAFALEGGGFTQSYTSRFFGGIFVFWKWDCQRIPCWDRGSWGDACAGLLVLVRLKAWLFGCVCIGDMYYNDSLIAHCWEETKLHEFGIIQTGWW